MEKVTLNTMLGSDYHRIVAQVLEIVEKTEFKPGKDVNILETGVEGVWKIVIPKKTRRWMSFKVSRHNWGVASA